MNRRCLKLPTWSGRGPRTSACWKQGSARRRSQSSSPASRVRPQPLLPAPPLRLPRRPPPWTCAPCCIAATARSSERTSCAQQRSGRRATSSARSSTKSATSLPSPSSPAPSRASASPSPSRWAWILGLAVTVAFLAWAVRGTQWSEVLAGLRAVDPLLLVLTVALATLTFPIRLIRWRVILRDEHERPLPWLPLWHAVAIGFMANNLLPARAGEFARAYVASRQLPVRFTTALGSIGVERVFDALVMLGLMALAIASPSFPAHSTLLDTPLSRLAGRAALLFGAMFVVALVVVLRPAPWLALFERVTRAVLPARLAARVAGMAEGLVAGLTVLKRPGRFGAMLFWSLVLWLTNAASVAVCFRAVGVQRPINWGTRDRDRRGPRGGARQAQSPAAHSRARSAGGLSPDRDRVRPARAGGRADGDAHGQRGRAHRARTRPGGTGAEPRGTRGARRSGGNRTQGRRCARADQADPGTVGPGRRLERRGGRTARGEHARRQRRPSPRAAPRRHAARRRCRVLRERRAGGARVGPGRAAVPAPRPAGRAGARGPGTPAHRRRDPGREIGRAHV